MFRRLLLILAVIVSILILLNVVTDPEVRTLLGILIILMALLGWLREEAQTKRRPVQFPSSPSPRGGSPPDDDPEPEDEQPDPVANQARQRYKKSKRIDGGVDELKRRARLNVEERDDV